ncbi:pentapeptide repeat-containing protein [Pseudomonas asplenii]|uniref:pentapeptide repeat-containing protein n=1 Tax=Pseudomonas asplenii TaxID=53407 RepID=UPI0023609635|nr:pentapeptide repeat-containing protein [Pseudomonas asplenii]
MNNRTESQLLSGVKRKDWALPEKTRFEQALIKGCELKNTNLAYPIFDQSLLQDCTFEKSDFSNARFFSATELVRCTFRNIDFRAAGLNDSVFRQCTFIKCDFRQSPFNDCVLVDCLFDTCKIIDNTFDAGKLENCSFSGKLQEVNFVAEQPNTMLRADFSACILDYVTFKNCNLEQISPPTDSRHLYVRDLAERARKALAQVTSQPESPQNNLLKRRLKNLAMQRSGIFNLKNLVEVEGQEFADQLISLLQQPG